MSVAAMTHESPASHSLFLPPACVRCCLPVPSVADTRTLWRFADSKNLRIYAGFICWISGVINMVRQSGLTRLSHFRVSVCLCCCLPVCIRLSIADKYANGVVACRASSRSVVCITLSRTSQSHFVCLRRCLPVIPL